jgi:7-carboxy-7-deazaguanine synthase
LAQKNCIELLRRLCDAGYGVSIETSGALSIADLDPRVVRVMDWKTPGSGESPHNLVQNLAELKARDQIKFVICDRADYEWSRQQVAGQRLAERCQVLFSPSHGQLAPKDLAEWILADKLPVRLQLQIHKYLWGNVPGH